MRFITLFEIIFGLNTSFDGFFIPMADRHSNELIKPQDNLVQFLSGFTGDLGFIFITRDKNYLIVDSRFYLQVKTEATDFEIIHYDEMKTRIPPLFGESHIAYLPEYVSVSTYKQLSNLVYKLSPIKGFRSTKSLETYQKIQTVEFYKKYSSLLNPYFLQTIFSYTSYSSSQISASSLLMNYLKVKDNIFQLEVPSLENTTSYKLSQIASLFSRQLPEYCVISSLSVIAWLLNVRGFDLLYTPLIESYILIKFPQQSQPTITWYIPQAKIDRINSQNLIFSNASIKEISTFPKHLSLIENSKIVIDPTTLNMQIYNTINKNNDIIQIGNRIEELKAVKSKDELEKSKKAALKDSLLFFKFWKFYDSLILPLKDESLNNLSLKKRLINEYQLVLEIERIRQSDNYYVMPAYGSIVGANENGAIVHYEPSPYFSKILRNGDVLLIDTGGQYYNLGTTDVTRVLINNNNNNAEIDELIKEDYTYVLKAQISVMKRKFMKEEFNTWNLDEIVRRTLKEGKGEGRGYGHGTSHGIGFMSDVHEAPYCIGCGKIKVNVIMSNEPGYCREGKWGIRLENDVYSYEEEGIFGLRNLTMTCYERKLIKVELLEESDVEFVNEYHREVREKFKWVEDEDEELYRFIERKCEMLNA